MSTDAPWQPFREPIHTTLLRNGAIAIGVGAIITLPSGALARWPAATLLALWPTLGGHFVELFFLTWLRPRIPSDPAEQIGARVATWFVGGVCLLWCVRWTAGFLPGFAYARRPAWWIGGLGFIGIELIVHLALQLRGRPNFYNGLG